MKVVVLASRKGGVGKTTLTGHLAVEAERQGAKVAIADLDPQAGLSAWFNVRRSTTPPFLDARQGLAAILKQGRAGGLDYLFVDTPPSVSDAAAAAVAAADLVVVPVRPSPHDLRAVGGTVELVEQAGKPLIFVCSQVTPRAKLTGQAAIALSQHGTVSPSMVSSRVDFASSMIDGRTVGELDAGSRSAAEITALWDYVRGRLEGQGGKPRARKKEAA